MWYDSLEYKVCFLESIYDVTWYERMFFAYDIWYTIIMQYIPYNEYNIAKCLICSVAKYNTIRYTG